MISESLLICANIFIGVFNVSTKSRTLPSSPLLIEQHTSICKSDVLPKHKFLKINPVIFTYLYNSLSIQQRLTPLFDSLL